MHARGLTRRATLWLPVALAACGSEPRQSFPPLRYDFLPPIGLNVAKIDVEQHFMPSGIPPDVSQFDPVKPTEALRQMAQDRLKALGSAGLAVFSIQDASLVRRGDTITGTMDVVLDIYPTPESPRAGFAEARVTRQHTGSVDDLPGTLYDMTKALMNAMNVEFEYQVRRSLRDWLATGTAVVPPVQARPLPSGAADAPPPGAPPSIPPPLPPAGATLNPR
jgi:hypothetical protein